MIVFEEQGDILHSAAQSLVCPVNTNGAMGKGLALAFRNAYPRLYPAYQQACRQAIFKREGLYVHQVSADKKVICLPTKRHWRYPSKLEWIEEGLYRLALDVEKYGITSLAVPALGCGEGKLTWEIVYPVIKRYMDVIEIPVAIYLPF